MMTNLSVHEISHTSSWILMRRQSCGQPPLRPWRRSPAQARLARVVVAEVRAAVMASKSGARAAAAAFCCSVDGLS